MQLNVCSGGGDGGDGGDGGGDGGGGGGGEIIGGKTTRSCVMFHACKTSYVVTILCF